MATEEQIDRFIVLLQKYPPERRYKEVDETTRGIGAVLQLLSHTEVPISASQISHSLNISTARVAVLLRKMKARNLVSGERTQADARIMAVQITDQGRECFQQIETDLRRKVGYVIDTIGMERVLEYAQITLEIHEALNAMREDPAERT